MHKTRVSPGLFLALALASLPVAAAQTETVPAGPSPAAASATASACALLTDAEIQTIQGEAPSDKKASAPTDAGLDISQCYFVLPTAAKSISLTLAQRGQGKQAQDPRRQWRSLFERGKDRDRDARPQGGEKEEEAETPPQKVGGIGDAAYWSASPVGGSLYVLKGHRYLRLSVGGPGDQAQKLGKSKALARLALKRL